MTTYIERKRLNAGVSCMYSALDRPFLGSLPGETRICCTRKYHHITVDSDCDCISMLLIYEYNTSIFFLWAPTQYTTFVCWAHYTNDCDMVVKMIFVIMEFLQCHHFLVNLKPQLDMTMKMQIFSRSILNQSASKYMECFLERFPEKELKLKASIFLQQFLIRGKQQ